VYVFAKSPDPDKYRMIASNYDRVVGFFTAFADLFVSTAFVQQDAGLRLRLDAGEEGLLQSIRDVFTFRQLHLDSYRETVRRVSQLHRLVPASTLGGGWDFAGSYRYVTEELQAPRPSLAESGGGLAVPGFGSLALPPVPSQPRRSVAFIKLLFAALPCRCSDQYFLAVFQIKPDRIDMFYNLALIEEPFGFRDLCLCLDLRIYSPSFLATHALDIQKLDLATLPETGQQVASQSLLAFYKTLKPTPALLKLLTNVLRARLVRVDSHKVLLQSRPPPYTDELLARPLGWSPAPAPRPAGHQVLVASDSMQELFAKQVRSADLETRQMSGEVFLKHYNTVKRIFGKQKFYLNVKYQNKTYQVRIRYAESQRMRTLC